MRNEPGVCAVCGSEDIEYGHLVDTEPIYVYYPITCNACGAKSEERYEMTHIGTFAEGEDE